jgi:site-specific DNA-methyltransferase (adenine-specific)
MESDSIDSIVSDPPYGLSFMGKGWDHEVPGVDFWTEALRVAKPGAFLLAFGGTRKAHRLAVAIEDAGWEIRDSIAWMYGSGFPKSLDVSKALDKAAGAEREVVGTKLGLPGYHLSGHAVAAFGRGISSSTTATRARSAEGTAPSTDLARQWQGWGTALKPAHEPIIVARKPLAGTVAANVERHGVGALNIGGCRIETSDDLNGGAYAAESSVNGVSASMKNPLKNACGKEFVQPTGRWPANVILDEEAGAMLDAQTGDRRSADDYPSGAVSSGAVGFGARRQGQLYADGGGASRFFYCAKASKSERNAGLASPNTHPTVKPIALMRYLVRLVTPPGGTVLDPFCGSGSTGVATVHESFGFVGCELDPAHVDIARARIAHAEGQQ